MGRGAFALPGRIPLREILLMEIPSSGASGEHIAWHDMEYHEEWTYLTQEVSRYMEEHGMEITSTESV